MRKWLIGMLLAFIAFFVWVPLWLLISGSLMGAEEMTQNLAPVLGNAEGTAVWPLLPMYPTLKPYIELLLDTPQFFAMFWNSCRQVFPVVIGQVLIGAPAAWAFARFHFRGKKILYSLYIVLMLMPFQVTMVSSYLVLDNLGLMNSIWAIILPGAVSTFPVFLMVRFFYLHPLRPHRGGGPGRGGPPPDFLPYRTPPGGPRHSLRRGAGLSGVLERTGAAPHLFAGQDPLAPVPVSAHRHGGQCRGQSGGVGDYAGARTADFPLRPAVSGGGDLGLGDEGLNDYAPPTPIPGPPLRGKGGPDPIY